MIKVSIVVPIYNVAPYLKRCVDSLTSQTYSNIEILLVDDGSTDNSFEIMKDLSKEEHRIRCLQKENGGLSSARNFGLKHCTGEYVLFIDSDDYVSCNMCERLINCAIATSSDVVVCDMEYFYDDKRRIFASGGEFTTGSVLSNPSLIRMNNSACNKLFKVELFNDIDFAHGLWYEDLATVPIVLCKANKITKVNEAMYFYYQRSGSIAHSANEKIFDIYKAIERVIDYITASIEEPLQSLAIKEMKHCFIIHGLDLTTLRIKDFDDVSLCAKYLSLNMDHLKRVYPNYKQDEIFKKLSIKKKVIYKLLEMKQWKWVLKLYGR